MAGHTLHQLTRKRIEAPYNISVGALQVVERQSTQKYVIEESLYLANSGLYRTELCYAFVCERPVGADSALAAHSRKTFQAKYRSDSVSIHPALPDRPFRTAVDFDAPRREGYRLFLRFRRLQEPFAGLLQV